MLRVVVPARLASSRLPEKMLCDIGGKTVLQRSIERVKAAADSVGADLTVSVGDYELLKCLIEDGMSHGEAIFTGDCRSGTDRCGLTASAKGWDDGDVVVNVQADMPFIDTNHLRGFLEAAALGQEAKVWDVLTAIAEHDMVTRVRNTFARSTVHCHVGLYAYRMEALTELCALPSTQTETDLGLEQLRAIENGFSIAYYQMPVMPFEVNTPADLDAARNMAECLA